MTSPVLFYISTATRISWRQQSCFIYLQLHIRNLFILLFHFSFVKNLSLNYNSVHVKVLYRPNVCICWIIHKVVYWCTVKTASNGTARNRHSFPRCRQVPDTIPAYPVTIPTEPFRLLARRAIPAILRTHTKGRWNTKERQTTNSYSVSCLYSTVKSHKRLQ